MQAVTLHQFWAAAMAPLLVKGIETRGWPTRHRGELAIHAAADVPAKARRIFRESEVVRRHLRVLGVETVKDLDDLPRGVVVGVCDLVACVPAGQMTFGVMDPEGRYVMPGRDEPEFAFGDYGPGRFMWFTENMRVLEEPVPSKGLQKLWALPGDVEARVREQLPRAAAA